MNKDHPDTLLFLYANTAKLYKQVQYSLCKKVRMEKYKVVDCDGTLIDDKNF